MTKQYIPQFTVTSVGSAGYLVLADCAGTGMQLIYTVSPTSIVRIFAPGDDLPEMTAHYIMPFSALLPTVRAFIRGHFAMCWTELHDKGALAAGVEKRLFN